MKIGVKVSHSVYQIWHDFKVWPRSRLCNRRYPLPDIRATSLEPHESRARRVSIVCVCMIDTHTHTQNSQWIKIFDQSWPKN